MKNEKIEEKDGKEGWEDERDEEKGKKRSGV
jgi:hypothetical protein